jgi:hypothetical protein
MFYKFHHRIIAGLVLLGFSMAAHADVSPGPRSLVTFTAVHDRYSLSIPWDMTKPTVTVPFKLPRRANGQAVFQGHLKPAGAAGNDVIGGDLAVKMGRNKNVFQDSWKERLAEVGTVTMPRGGPQEIYFVSMEGGNGAAETWHFNLFNPLTSALITVSFHWAHDDNTALRETSKNFKDPALVDEADLLEKVVHDPDYGIPGMSATATPQDFPAGS